MNYDSFMSEEVHERRRLWLTFTKGEVVSLIATHRRRWLDAHRDSLTPDQLAVLEEDIVFIENELAHTDTNPVFAAHQKQLQRRILALLPREIIDELSLIPRKA
jgi:predicted ThiF/HesA family dinucleotide-utilizing enzyme